MALIGAQIALQLSLSMKPSKHRLKKQGYLSSFSIAETGLPGKTLKISSEKIS
jgi:hypothetical protein